MSLVFMIIFPVFYFIRIVFPIWVPMKSPKGWTMEGSSVYQKIIIIIKEIC